MSRLHQKSHAPAHVDAPKSLAQNESSPTTVQASSPARRGRIVTTDDGRREIRLVVTDEEFEVFRETQDLLGHAIPSGDPALVIVRALEVLRTQLKKRKFGAKSVASSNGETGAVSNGSVAVEPTLNAPAKGTGPDDEVHVGELERSIPASDAQDAATKPSPANEDPRLTEYMRTVRSAQRQEERAIPMDLRSFIWRRDGGCCAFVGRDGHRCGSRRKLEFDHIIPLAQGGRTVPENLRLLCRAHNQFEAKRRLGTDLVKSKRELAKRTRERDRAAKKAEKARAAKPNGERLARCSA